MNRAIGTHAPLGILMSCVMAVAGCGRSASAGGNSEWMGSWYSIPMNQPLELKVDSAVFGPTDKRVTQPLQIAGKGDGYTVVTLLTNGQPTAQATLALTDDGQSLVVGGDGPFVGRYRRTSPGGAPVPGGEMMHESTSGAKAPKP